MSTLLVCELVHLKPMKQYFIIPLPHPQDAPKVFADLSKMAKDPAIEVASIAGDSFKTGKDTTTKR